MAALAAADRKSSGHWRGHGALVHPSIQHWLAIGAEKSFACARRTTQRLRGTTVPILDWRGPSRWSGVTVTAAPKTAQSPSGLAGRRATARPGSFDREGERLFYRRETGVKSAPAYWKGRNAAPASAIVHLMSFHGATRGVLENGAPAPRH